ncbi:DUF2344 domain-containing protein [Elusimicrobium minutum]|nr:DUF2344 domain-containing protein [Elusimicrobium minutum]
MRIRYARGKYMQQGEISAAWRDAVLKSALPYAAAEKINKSWPRLTFGPPLAQGVLSNAEYVDLYFTQNVKESEVKQNILFGSDKGIKILEVKSIPYQFPSVANLTDAVEYEVRGIQKYNPVKLEEFLSGKNIFITVNQENISLEIDIKPYIYKALADGDTLKIILQTVNGKSQRVELFLARWLNLDFPLPGEGFKKTEVEIIKQKLYYANSLGGYSEV